MIYSIYDFKRLTGNSFFSTQNNQNEKNKMTQVTIPCDYRSDSSLNQCLHGQAGLLPAGAPLYITNQWGPAGHLWIVRKITAPPPVCFVWGVGGRRINPCNKKASLYIPTAKMYWWRLSQTQRKTNVLVFSTVFVLPLKNNNNNTFLNPSLLFLKCMALSQANSFITTSGSHRPFHFFMKVWLFNKKKHIF